MDWKNKDAFPQMTAEESDPPLDPDDVPYVNGWTLVVMPRAT